MNRFYIAKLIVSRGGHESSIISFSPGLNFIIGPSNTGKSLVMDCIDYVFGFSPKNNRPSKIVDNNYGYEMVSLHLATASGLVILERKIGDSKITVSGTDCTIEHGTYSITPSAKKSINMVFLQLIGIHEPHKILSTEKGKTQELTWRGLLHLFFMRQVDISRESSALYSPNGFGKTSSPAALLYLLTGQDADNLEENEDPKISTAKRKALIQYMHDKIERFGKRREELEDIISNCEFPNLQEAVDLLRAEIDFIQKQFDIAVMESQKLMAQIYEQNSKLSECNTISHNFSVLYSQYQSDIRRLDFIVEGKMSSDSVASKNNCPFCNTKIIKNPSPQYLEASLAELNKIKGHLIELEAAQQDINRKRQTTVDAVRTLENKKEEVDCLISGQLTPKLSEFKNQLENNLSLIRIGSELEVIRQNEAQYKSELFEKETEESTPPTKYNIFDYYTYELVHGFEQKLVEILSASKIGGATTARLNMTNFDIEIGGLKKSVSMGGGFCAILNTITALAMSSYLIEHNCKSPGFFAADSVLTQLSEAEYIDQQSTIKRNFIQYLVDHARDRQVIIVEQKKRMPFIPMDDEEKGIRIIEFSRNKHSGRYGFLNNVYNVEDR